MKWRRLSLFYLCTNLLIIGTALLLLSSVTLRVMQSNGHHGEIMPRLRGC